MAFENCKNKQDLSEETKAIRGASEMAQRYKLLCGAVVALVIGFAVMAGCMVYAVTNAQRIANEAVLEALYAMAEIEVTTETTTQTVEGDSATINNGEWEQYNDNAVNQGGGNLWRKQRRLPRKPPLPSSPKKPPSVAPPAANLRGDWMTSDDVRRIIGNPYKPLALAALPYVNLTDRECNLLILRHMRGHTQEETAEEMGYTVRAVQSWEKTALDKCADAWKNIIFVQELLKAVQ